MQRLAVFEVVLFVGFTHSFCVVVKADWACAGVGCGIEFALADIASHGFGDPGDVSGPARCRQLGLFCGEL